MKTLRRTKFGNPILRKKTQQISKIPSDAFIKSMFYTMKRANGVGLAAPQVGKSWSIAVIEIKKTKVRPNIKPFQKTVIINPLISKRSAKMEKDWEGCLSFPSVRGLVPRHQSITVTFINEKGKKYVLKLTGFQARVFQHEIDHLNGILYIDRMRDIKTLMTMAEFEKRILKTGLKSR